MRANMGSIVVMNPSVFKSRFVCNFGFVTKSMSVSKNLWGQDSSVGTCVPMVDGSNPGRGRA